MDLIDMQDVIMETEDWANASKTSRHSAPQSARVPPEFHNNRNPPTTNDIAVQSVLQHATEVDAETEALPHSDRLKRYHATTSCRSPCPVDFNHRGAVRGTSDVCEQGLGKGVSG